MADPAHGAPTQKKKYDLPGMIDPATLPKDETLERSKHTAHIPIKRVAPRKVRRLV